MSVVLDGKTYDSLGTGYTPMADRAHSDNRGLTGYPLRLEGGAFKQEYDMMFLCSISDIANLETSFAKINYAVDPPTNRLSFVDEEGISWFPGTGINDATHFYGTGVYFAIPIVVKPMTQRGYADPNLFEVAVHLIAYSDVMLAPYAPEYLLAEDGSILNTENGDRILWE